MLELNPSVLFQNLFL